MALGGCGSELTAAGANVKVGKGAPEGHKCRELGIVYGSGGGGGYTGTQAKLEWAQNELRNKTAELGGNFVIMDASSGDAAGISISGRALSCTEAPPEAVPVRITSGSEQNAEPIAAPASPEERLRKLDDLHQKGLVSDEEHQKRRKEIIDSL